VSESPRENDTPDGERPENTYSDPTAPYPQQYSPQDAGPTPPPSAASPYGTPGPSATGPTTPAGPYDTPAPYGAPGPYGAQGAPYGTPPPAYYQSAPPQSNTSALVLTIVSAIGTLSCCLPLPALILGILALTKQSTEPDRSAQLAKYGWITFGAMFALAAIAFIAFIGFSVITSSTTSDF
jgi:hypothetical protein